jgi:hypothetical protein
MDRAASKFFSRLKTHSADRALLEEAFETKLAIGFHECFWELHLPVALCRFGFSLQRGAPPAPDFLFSNGAATVFLEAVACGEPGNEDNRVPDPAWEGSTDLEDGIVPDGRIMRCLSAVIDAKIRCVTRQQAQSAMGKSGLHCVVLAVNGWRANNGWTPNIPEMGPPQICRALFGAVENRIAQGGQQFWVQDRQMGKDRTVASASFPLGHFDEPTWPVDGRPVSIRQIAGVLYSSTCVWNSAEQPGDDYIYVQNPHGPDLTATFGFCRQGVWVREPVRPEQYRLRNLAVGDGNGVRQA